MFVLVFRDQKYCCVSQLYKVSVGSCAGGSASLGAYKYTNMRTGDIPAGPLDINTLGKTHPLVRQFDDNFKYTNGSYDYTIYICGTETDPSSTCGTAVIS